MTKLSTWWHRSEIARRGEVLVWGLAIVETLALIPACVVGARVGIRGFLAVFAVPIVGPFVAFNSKDNLRVFGICLLGTIALYPCWPSSHTRVLSAGALAVWFIVGIPLAIFLAGLGLALR